MSGGGEISASGPRRILIQVVPQLAPGRSGVSDHATQLARALKEEFGIESAFLAVNGKTSADVPFAVIECPAPKLLESCIELSGERRGAILVQVSGYGYSPDGAPGLLADALDEVRASGRFRMAAYFHELYATGPPWKPAFWHSRRQQRAVRKLAACCELVMTNTARHAEWLRRETRNLAGTAAELIPVLSTVGEAKEPVPFSRRNAVIGVFGLPGSRKLAYRKIAESGDLFRILGINEIHDIGPDCDAPSEVSGIAVKRIGVVPLENVPHVFSQFQFGFVAHRGEVLGKSGVLASYCAQGVIPVVAEAFTGNAEGLRDGVNVVSPQSAEIARKAGWEACAQAAWSWYMTHSVRVHAERCARWMGEEQ